MNNKGQWVWGIIIIFIFIVIALVVIGSILVINHSDSNKNSGSNITRTPMQIFLTTLDSDSQSQISADYLILDNSTILAQGQTAQDAITEADIGINQSADIYCWNGEYYMGHTNKVFTDYDMKYKQSKIDCPMKKIGKLNVQVQSADLSQPINFVVLNLTAIDGEVKDIGMCFSWSIGIVMVDASQNSLSCKNGAWKNYSNYYVDSQGIGQYVWLTNSTYLCGDNQYMKCDSVNGDQCVHGEMDVPDRFLGHADECYYLGSTLDSGQEKDISLSVRTLNPNSQDFIDINFFDYDTRFLGNQMVHLESINNKDIAGQDVNITILNQHV